MAININTNIPALRSRTRLNNTSSMLNNHLSRLASGKRINSAKDDAAGLAISEELTAQVRALAQAERNTYDGISLSQTAEGGLNQTGDALIRMRELAIQSGNGTLSDEDRQAINAEMDSLKSEVDRVAATTEFNGKKLLDGSAEEGISFQVGTSGSSPDQITVSMGAMGTANLGQAASPLANTTVSTAEGAGEALATIDHAIGQVSSMRSNLGSTQNLLATQANQLATTRESLTASNSRIRDADMAAETTALIKNQILMQSSAAVMAQANQLPAVALSLLG